MKNIQLLRFLKYVGVGKFKAIRSPPPSWQRGKPSRDPRRMQTYGSPPAPARARPSGKKGLSAAKKDGVVPVGAAPMPRGRPEEAGRGAPGGEGGQVQAARSPSQKEGRGTQEISPMPGAACPTVRNWPVRMHAGSLNRGFERRRRARVAPLRKERHPNGEVSRPGTGGRQQARPCQVLDARAPQVPRMRQHLAGGQEHQEARHNRDTKAGSAHDRPPLHGQLQLRQVRPGRGREDA